MFIANSQHQLYVQKRTMTKDIYPGFHDFAPGGVVLASDQSDMEVRGRQSARRELVEEMGIENAQLEHLFQFYFENERTKVWGAAFLTWWDGPIRMQPEEVESVRLLSLNEIKADIAHGVQFCPDSLLALQHFLRLNKLRSEN